MALQDFLITEDLCSMAEALLLLFESVEKCLGVESENVLLPEEVLMGPLLLW
jgi:hypothetical protein